MHLGDLEAGAEHGVHGGGQHQALGGLGGRVQGLTQLLEITHLGL